MSPLASSVQEMAAVETAARFSYVFLCIGMSLQGTKKGGKRSSIVAYTSLVQDLPVSEMPVDEPGFYLLFDQHHSFRSGPVSAAASLAMYLDQASRARAA